MNLNKYKANFLNLEVFSLFLGVGLIIYLLPALGYFTKVPGDLGDARFNSVILEHIYQWLIGNEPSLWSPKFFYPYEKVLGFSDNHFGSAIFYIFFRSLGFGRELAFDGWFFVGSCLNFIAGYCCLRRLGFSGFVAAAGAFVFAFSLPGLNQEGHAQLLYRFPVPLAFLGLWRFFHEKKVPGIYVAAFWTAFQFYCSIYLGVFLVYLLLAVTFVYLIIDYKKDRCVEFWTALRSTRFRNLIFSVIVTLVCIFSTAWLLYQYKVISDYYGLARSWHEIASMLPRLSSYLLADRAELSGWLGNLISGIPMRHEHQMFFGFGVWAVFIYGLFSLIGRQQNYQTLGKTCLLSLCLVFLATLNINGLTLYKVIASIPGLDAVRAVSRIILVMMFPVAVIVAIGCHHLLNLNNDKNRFIRTSIIVGILALLGGETLFYQPVNTPISLWKERKATAKKLLPEQLPENPILFLTKKEGEPFYFAELDGMILAQDMGLPTLNGYSGHLPPGYQIPPRPCISPIGRIMGYTKFHDLSMDRAEELSSRVVKLDFEPCKQTIKPFTGNIPEAQAREIRIEILKLNFNKTENQITAQLRITNKSSKTFSTISAAGKHVRLSWRFVRGTNSGRRTNQPGWNTRKNLFFSLDPSESAVVEFSTNMPDAPGNYILEASLVQEGVAWFHNIGMPVGKAVFELHKNKITYPLPAENKQTPSARTEYPIQIKGSSSSEIFSILGSGWHELEKSHVWSGAEAELLLPVPEKCQKSKCEAEITLSVYGAGKNRPVDVYFRVNNQNLKGYHPLIARNRGTRTVRVPLPTDGSKQKVSIEVPEATSPKDLGESQDSRILGVALHSIELMHQEKNASSEGLRRQEFTEDTLLTQVGSVENGAVVTTGQAGFLIYGPYEPVEAGKYRLVLKGAGSSLASAWADVVSGKGTVQHAKFPLSQSEEKNADILLSEQLTIESPVEDLEVRIHVGDKDDLRLTGYELKPVAETKK